MDSHTAHLIRDAFNKANSYDKTMTKLINILSLKLTDDGYNEALELAIELLKVNLYE